MNSKRVECAFFEKWNSHPNSTWKTCHCSLTINDNALCVAILITAKDYHITYTGSKATHPQKSNHSISATGGPLSNKHCNAVDLNKGVSNFFVSNPQTKYFSDILYIPHTLALARRFQRFLFNTYSTIFWVNINNCYTAIPVLKRYLNAFIGEGR